MVSSSAFGESAAVIAGYGPSGFTIHNTLYPHAVCVSAQHVGIWDGELKDTALIDALTANALHGEILLIGTGAFHLPLLPTLRREIKQRFGLSVETMDTGAACRTFNILHSEGRQVVALLKPIG